MELEICFRDKGNKSGNINFAIIEINCCGDIKSFRIIEQYRNKQNEFEITPKSIEVIHWVKKAWYTNLKEAFIFLIFRLKKLFGYNAGYFKVK